MVVRPWLPCRPTADPLTRQPDNPQPRPPTRRSADPPKFFFRGKKISEGKNNPSQFFFWPKSKQKTQKNIFWPKNIFFGQKNNWSGTPPPFLCRTLFEVTGRNLLYVLRPTPGNLKREVFVLLKCESTLRLPLTPQFWGCWRLVGQGSKWFLSPWIWCKMAWRLDPFWGHLLSF